MSGAAPTVTGATPPPREPARERAVANLRDRDPANDAVEGAAISFGLGLAVARIGIGLVEVVFPRLFLRVLGHRGTATDGAALGFRMKGGRDVGIGLATLGAAALGDRSTFAQLTATGVVIDCIDGLAVARDEGRSLRRPVWPTGAWLGYAVAAAAAAAAWVLGREG